MGIQLPRPAHLYELDFHYQNYRGGGLHHSKWLRDQQLPYQNDGGDASTKPNAQFDNMGVQPASIEDAILALDWFAAINLTYDTHCTSCTENTYDLNGDEYQLVDSVTIGVKGDYLFPGNNQFNATGLPGQYVGIRAVGIRTGKVIPHLFFDGSGHNNQYGKRIPLGGNLAAISRMLEYWDFGGWGSYSKASKLAANGFQYIKVDTGALMHGFDKHFYARNQYA